MTEGQEGDRPDGEKGISPLFCLSTVGLFPAGGRNKPREQGFPGISCLRGWERDSPDGEKGISPLFCLSAGGAVPCGGLYDFYVRRRKPALAAVGKFDVVPGADGIDNPDLGAFVKDEQVLGSLS